MITYLRILLNHNAINNNVVAHKPVVAANIFQSLVMKLVLLFVLVLAASISFAIVHTNVIHVLPTTKAAHVQRILPV